MHQTISGETLKRVKVFDRKVVDSFLSENLEDYSKSTSGRALYSGYDDLYYWTRSRQKKFTEWLEYMEKCIEMAKKYGGHITWYQEADSWLLVVL